MLIKKTTIKYIAKTASLVFMVLLFSCSPVKYIPRDSYLLNKVELEVDNPDISKEEAKSHIRQKENYKILGFAKFHLWLYNLSSKKRDDSWFKRIGEPPEVYNQALVDASKDRLEQYLDNKGYFRGSVSSEVNFKEKSRKANIKYIIQTGEQYKIRKVNYHIGDSALRALLLKDTANLYLSPETPFDFTLLEKQRNDIVELYKNNGYFYFSKDDVSYLADSTKFEKSIFLDIFIGETAESDTTTNNKFIPFYLNHFYLSVLPTTGSFTTNREFANTFSDTVLWKDITLFSNSEVKFRPNLFEELIQMQSGSLYRLEDARNTFNAFNRLRQFRFIDIQFRDSQTVRDTQLLDCYIRFAPLNKQFISFDIEGTNTSGNFGVAGNINYKHRNLFRGAELLQLNFKGAMERQQRVVEDKPEYFNTREFGVESNMTVPKLLGPGRVLNVFRDYLPKTIFTLGYNFQRRPEYTRTIANLKIGYNWMTSENLTHTWNLIDFNMVNLYKFDPQFINYIKDLYIKSSFTDHLIFAMNYSFVHNTQKLNIKKNYLYLRFNMEPAGNLLGYLSSVTGRTKVYVTDTISSRATSYYKIFNTRFAQYLKSDMEFRYGYVIDKYNSLVGRAFIGIGFPYGNFDVLPFEKKYFTGGANGIRAWQVRSLGPGTYSAPPDAYPNQSSDIKLEANLEYRFNLISFMEGAFFLDAGNIWAINHKDNRPGAQFKFNKFYKQLAFGTGTGFRFDFNYFIFRLDIGMKLRDPSQELGNGWIIGNRSLKSDDFNLSFAIGYPF